MVLIASNDVFFLFCLFIIQGNIYTDLPAVRRLLNKEALIS